MVIGLMNKITRVIQPLFDLYTVSYQCIPHMLVCYDYNI